MFTVYVLYNLEDDKYYIGQTNDLGRRLAEHNSKEKGFTARVKGDWVVVYQRGMESRREAMRHEKYLKSYKNKVSLGKYIAG